MKIAITADLHLKTRKEVENRYNALEKIINHCKKNNVEKIIIAGDLFDENFLNYFDFDQLCKSTTNMNFYIIPGNHDMQLNTNSFTASNIKIFNNTDIEYFDNIAFLFVPYNRTKSIDEIITSFWQSQPIPNEWILIGHGDYISSIRTINEYEDGIYMPISAKAINVFNPLKVILGHIHKYSEFGKVIYPGSPYPLNINETGKRFFLVYDTNIRKFEKIPIETEVIYFVENLMVVPEQDEKKFVEQKLMEIINKWQLTDEEHRKVKLRLNVYGYTKNYQEIITFIKTLLNKHEIQLYDNNELQTQNLYTISPYDDKIYLIKEIKKELENTEELKFATKEQILEEIMKLIFK